MSPALDIAIPVHNREDELAVAVRRLHGFLQKEFPFTVRITIADCASTDDTWLVAATLADELPDVRVLSLNENGRGRALAAAWLTSDARVVAHIDVGLSTKLSSLPALVAPVMSGNSDLSIESPVRGDRGEQVSRSHNVLLRLVRGLQLNDAERRFKALRAEVARRLLPRVPNRNWLFDAELLLEAERAGLRITEVTVDAVVEHHQARGSWFAPSSDLTPPAA